MLFVRIKYYGFTLKEGVVYNRLPWPWELKIKILTSYSDIYTDVRRVIGFSQCFRYFNRFPVFTLKTRLHYDCCSAVVLLWLVRTTNRPTRRTRVLRFGRGPKQTHQKTAAEKKTQTSSSIEHGNNNNNRNNHMATRLQGDCCGSFREMRRDHGCSTTDQWFSTSLTRWSPDWISHFFVLLSHYRSSNKDVVRFRVPIPWVLVGLWTIALYFLM